MKNLSNNYRRLLFTLCLIGGMSSPISRAATRVNLALKVANVSASVQNGQSSLIVDNNRGTAWKTSGGEAYVELQWSATAQIEQVSVYWTLPLGGMVLPEESHLAYWNGEIWVAGESLAAIDNNISTVETLMKTRRLRIYLNSSEACGIREVRLLGYEQIYPEELYEWPAYSSPLNYNYRSDYPEGVEPPTKFLPEDNGQVGVKTYGWWAFAWGPNRNEYVTDKAIEGLLKKMDEDFGYFREKLGWLPDKRARKGYYSTVYLFGSGLKSDNASNTDLGGWQSATWYNGSSWPMVYLSYYPVACFDPAFTYDKFHNQSVNDQIGQQNACVHEGIHAVFADLEGCKNSPWFHESGNTAMQADAELSKTPNVSPASMGFLSASNMIAPFIPIECYSGWLLDGSFGGPGAEGVNLFKDGKQVCTWRNLLGGNQYGELFPHFLSVKFGEGALPWIWRYCKDRVLSGISDTLGDIETRRLVREYRVKQAMIDFGKWSTAARALVDNNWQLSIKQEWSPYKQTVEEWRATPYAKMFSCSSTDSVGWWYPEYRTTPGWSGANQIPLHVSGNQGDIIRIYFKPLGENMECQLAYRSKRGKVFYSQPIKGEGEVAMLLEEVPANNVVIAVVCNTDYLYKGESTRKAHYDYRLKMMDNAYQPAAPNLKWYSYRTTLVDNSFDKKTVSVEAPLSEKATFGFTPGKQVVNAGEQLDIHFTGATQWMVQVCMFAANGENIYNQSFLRDGCFEIPIEAKPGIYFLQGQNGGQTVTEKIIVK